MLMNGRKKDNIHESPFSTWTKEIMAIRPTELEEGSSIVDMLPKTPTTISKPSKVSSTLLRIEILNFNTFLKGLPWRRTLLQ